MGWKGTVRSVRAAYRAAERDAGRRQRELERRAREQQKQAALEQAAQEVADYEQRIADLTSIHREHGPTRDWRRLARAAEPPEPRATSRATEKARAAEASYRPGFLDRLLRREGARRSELASQVDEARRLDESRTRETRRKWKLAHRDWREKKDLALRVLDGQPAAYLEVLDAAAPFSHVPYLGRSVRLGCGSPEWVEAEISVHAEDLIPTETKQLLRSGRLSVKTMPKGQYFQIYQDYVCGCVLRVAHEIFALLPVENIVVTATTEMLDTSTGHLEESPIVSALVPRRTIMALDSTRLDASDSMANFVHAMRLERTKGFRPVERLGSEAASSKL